MVVECRNMALLRQGAVRYGCRWLGCVGQAEIGGEGSIEKTGEEEIGQKLREIVFCEILVGLSSLRGIKLLLEVKVAWGTKAVRNDRSTDSKKLQKRIYYGEVKGGEKNMKNWEIDDILGILFDYDEMVVTEFYWRG